MATTTQNTPTVRVHALSEILNIADAAQIKHSLEEMFYAYVWDCTGRDEEEHEIICAVYHGLIGLVDQVDAEKH